MKVALISVPNHFDNHMLAPSLSIASLSSCVKAAGMEVDCIDCNFLKDEQINSLSSERGKYVTSKCLQLLEKSSPDVFCISSWGVSLPFALILALTIREHFPKGIIIVGGVRDYWLAQMILGYSESVDAVVVGEGEMVLVDVLCRIQAGADFAGIAGFVYKHGDSIQVGHKPLPLPICKWGKPDYTSFMHELTTNYLLEGSRGCSHNCIFCSINGELLRRKNPIRFANDFLELTNERGATAITLTDNFIPLRGQWMERFCNKLIEAKSTTEWSCCTRADNFSKAIIELMVKAGCGGIFIGVESGASQTLEFIGKTKTINSYRSNIVRNVLLAKDSGLDVQVSTIIGLPSEQPKNMFETVDLVCHLRDKGVCAYTGPIVVYPGTQLWHFCRENHIPLNKIRNQSIRRNSAGYLSESFEDLPYFVPNNFLPQNKFLDFIGLEEVIATCLDATRSKIA